MSLRRVRVDALVVALALLVAASGSAQSTPRTAPPAPVAPMLAAEPAAPAAALAAERAAFLAELNALRSARGLVPLRAAEALDRAAQAQVEDMRARDYFALRSPDGREIEDWIAATGYDAQLVTEKVLRATAGPAELAAGWRAAPEKLAQSLLHPDVREVGIGLAPGAGERLVALALARSRADYLAEQTAATAATVVAAPADLEAQRAAYLAAVNAARASRGLSPLRADALLARAAQAHAEAILALRSSGAALAGARSLGDRVVEERERLSTSAGTAQATKGFRRLARNQPTASRSGGVGESLVTDAADGAEAVATALALEHLSALTEAGYQLLGVGVATTGEGVARRTLWVAALTRLRD